MLCRVGLFARGLQRYVRLCGYAIIAKTRLSDERGCRTDLSSSFHVNFPPVGAVRLVYVALRWEQLTEGGGSCEHEGEEREESAR